jgi:retron-type reverse transcriptase
MSIASERRTSRFGRRRHRGGRRDVAQVRLDREDNLRDLHRRVHCGSYRAKSARRAYIPKRDGRLRPLGVAALEDRILERAVGAESVREAKEVTLIGAV